jgi:hypothetical protein
VAHSLEDIAKRLLGDPPSEAYTSSIPTVLDKHKPELDKLSYAERLQVRRGERFLRQGPLFEAPSA